MNRYKFKASTVIKKESNRNIKYIFVPSEKCKNMIEKTKDEGVSQNINKILRFNK